MTMPSGCSIIKVNGPVSMYSTSEHYLAADQEVGIATHLQHDVANVVTAAAECSHKVQSCKS